MVTSVTADEAAERLPELLALIDRGELVVITTDDQVVAELVPVRRPSLLPEQSSSDVRTSLLTGTESLNDQTMPLPRL